MLPKNILNLNELAALVCAQDFTAVSESYLYLGSGLIHLFVVSGSHLLILEKIISIIYKPLTQKKLFIFIIFFIYGCLCNMNPPILRSLSSIFLSLILKKLKINWPTQYKILISGFLCICLDYQLINSLSLQLSWIAAFTTAELSNSKKKIPALFKQSIFFCLLIPPLALIQTPNPIVIISNILLAPALEYILFPLALLTSIFHFLSPVFDGLMFLLKNLLLKLEFNQVIMNYLYLKNFTIIIWSYIFFMHIAVHVHAVMQARKTSK